MEPGKALQDRGLAGPVRIDALAGLPRGRKARIVQKDQKRRPFGIGIGEGLARVGQTSLVGAHQDAAVVGKLARDDLFPKCHMGAQQGMADHGKGAVTGVKAFPLAQGLAVEPVDQPARPGKPGADRRVGRRADREKQQGRRVRGHGLRDRGGAAGFEHRGAGQGEQVGTGQGGGQVLRIFQLGFQRFGVLLFQRVIDGFQPPLDPEKGGKTIQHLDRAEIVIVQHECGLARGLQGVQHPQLKGLRRGQMGGEFIGVEACGCGFQAPGIGQFPLAGGAGDFPADIAVDRVAGQDDLGHARIGQHDVGHAGIVVVKEAETGQARRFSTQLAQQGLGVRLTVGKGNPKQFQGVLLADEMGVEHLSVA